MFRRVVLSVSNKLSEHVSLVYYVKSARPISQAKVVNGNYYNIGSNPAASSPIIFNDAVRLATLVSTDKSMYHFFDFDVGENQPNEERVMEITSTGVAIAVYNANGVLVCDNGVANIPSSDPTQSGEVQNGPGEMTSVPGEEPGEMTSEPIGGSGEMTSEPVGGTGATI